MAPWDIQVRSTEATTRSTENYIVELQLEFDEVLQKGTRTNMLEEMQRSVYILVARKEGDLIYNSVCQALVTRLRKVRASILDEVDDRFIETVNQAWREYRERAKMICDVVKYLEQVFVPQSHLDSLESKSIKLFRDEVLRSRDVQAKLCDKMLSLVEEDRKGSRPVNRAILKEACDMLAAADIDSNSLYEQVFEEQLLKESAKFYITLDLDLKETSNYISQVKGLVEKESELSKSCFRDSTIDLLISVLIDKLVVQQDSLMRCILSNHNTEELADVVTMCRPVHNGIARLVNTISRHTREMGEVVVSGCSETINVAAIIDMKKYLDRIVEECFHSDNTVKDVFSKDLTHILLINNEMPSHLAAFIVDTIEKKMTSFEGQLLMDIDEWCTLLKVDKNIFEMYCQFFWAKKLLRSESPEETERPSAVKLKSHFSEEFVSWMQAFEKELETSNSIVLEFKKLRPSATVEVNVSTVQAGLLPIAYETQRTIISEDPWKGFKAFKHFYSDNYIKRQLILQPNLGSASMNALFHGPQSPREYTLCVTTHQMCILLLFNDCDKMSFRDIADRTNIPEAALIRALKPLIEERSGSKCLLYKNPSSDTVNYDDFFIVNEKFMSQDLADFTKVPEETKFLMRSSEPHLYIDKQRMFQVEAAIIRVMKAQRKLAQNELLCEVNRELGDKCSISPAAFQKRLDSLVHRQFIEKACEDPAKYCYVP